MNIAYWFWIGTLYLIILTYQDYKDNRIVDDRRNYFMMGLSISLMSHVYTRLIYKVILTLVVVGLQYALKKIKELGHADIHSITWIFIGFGLLSAYHLLFFVVVFSILALVFVFFKNHVFKMPYPVQFYGVILLSYVFTSIVLGMY